MRKGQIEIIGLLLIVVIGGLVLTFFLQMSLQEQEDSRAHERFGEAGISDKFVSALVNTHVPQCGKTYSELVKDCARGGSVECPTEDGVRTSCGWVENVSKDVLKETIDIWGLRYNFTVDYGEDSFNVTRNCNATMEKVSPGRQSLSLWPQSGNAEVILQICET